MDIRDMRCFFAVAEAGNISRAAKRLNMAQPPLSRQMKQLEARLGAQLFERGSRQIKLTEAGRLLRQRAEQILELVDGTAKEITELNSGSGGTLSIGTVTTSGAVLLPGLIDKFYRLYPNVKFQLWEGDGYRVLELLDSGVIEIGIIRAPFDTEKYDAVVLPAEPLVIAMKAGECCCGEVEDAVRLSELAGKPLIIPRRWRSMFAAWCEKAGFAPNIVCVSDGILLNTIWTKLGIGMALVPRSTEALLADPALIYKRIVDPAVSTQTAVVWARNRRLSAASQHFLALLRSANAGQI